jgi:hypothetical protein
VKRRLLFAALLCSAALAAVPAVALAAESSAQIAPTAQLQARGAYVIATVQITCPVGKTLGYFPTTLSIVQATSKSALATGSGYAPGTDCTGSPQTFVIPVTANAPGPPFRVGPAAATLMAWVCDAGAMFNCTVLNTGPVTIRIVH